MVRAFKGQKYGNIKKDCLKTGELFVDPEFPPNTRSIFHSKIDNTVEWKRPGELCKVPKLVVAGVTVDDLHQGELGNCWFVSACAGLAREMKMFNKVVPGLKEQEWPDEGQEGKYAGIFHFQFWRYGDWIDVVVDDMLPTRNNKLIFCHSSAKNEFWSALLEKAYSKLYGDYEKLNDGFTSDALVDFTGGVAEKIQLANYVSADDETKYRLFIDLQDAVLGSSFVTANIECGREQVGQEASQGLIKGHGYTLTNVKDVGLPKPLQQQYGRPSLKMIRLNNPWGTKEWTGPWSDGSAEWTQLTQKDRNKLGIVFRQEGEFWMTLDDFIKNFSKCEICHIYTFDITSDMDSIIVSLEQNDQQIGAQKVSIDEIGFHIMRVETNRKYRIHLPLEKVYASDYTKSRNVFKRVPLNRGRYIIIPSTKEPRISSEFLLRLYSSHKNSGKELTKEAPKPAMPCLPKHPMVTQVTGVKATGLQKKPGSKDTMDPYIVIKCEGDTVKGLPVKNTQEPQWNPKPMAIFFRKKPQQKPVVIELYNRNRVIDDFLGTGEILECGTETKPAVVNLELYGKGKEAKGKEKEVKKPGKVTIELKSSSDLEYF